MGATTLWIVAPEDGPTGKPLSPRLAVSSFGGTEKASFNDI